MVWYSCLFKSFPQLIMIHIVKGFSIVNETEVDDFMKSLAFYMNQWLLVIWSLVPLPFSKLSLNIWKLLILVLLKPSLKNFEHKFTSMGDECNHLAVWTFFSISLFENWDESWPFPVLWPLLVFQICWHIECSTIIVSSFRILTFTCICCKCSVNYRLKRWNCQVHRNPSNQIL